MPRLTADLLKLKAEIVERHGPWEAHNIRISDEVQTIGPQVATIELKVKRFVQIVADVGGKPFSELQLLDLACGEGLYAVELARHGTRVVAIEGREANIAKARFAKDALELDNLHLIKGDVRAISRERTGEFDVTLCAGILYHLDGPDLFPFVEAMANMTKRLLIIDTHFGTASQISYKWKERVYWGDAFVEHALDSALEQRLADNLASLDNPHSFWLTRPSLYNLLLDSGFTSVYECHVPVTYDLPNRIALIALKGTRPPYYSIPPELHESRERAPEVFESPDR
jgi:SAM-dependent methyltransferase